MILATSFSQGHTHDFALFKASRLPMARPTHIKADSGYLGLKNWHPEPTHTQTPHKKSKHHPLSPDQKQANRELAQERVPIEGVFGWCKRFHILVGPYRNRGKRFALRFNLIAALYNAHL
jgi:hypothetical protein